MFFFLEAFQLIQGVSNFYVTGIKNPLSSKSISFLFLLTVFHTIYLLFLKGIRGVYLLNNINKILLFASLLYLRIRLSPN